MIYSRVDVLVVFLMLSKEILGDFYCDDPLAHPGNCPSLSFPVRTHALEKDRKGGENHVNAPNLSYFSRHVMMGGD